MSLDDVDLEPPEPLQNVDPEEQAGVLGDASPSPTGWDKAPPANGAG
jgi:hypothetical protein